MSSPKCINCERRLSASNNRHRLEDELDELKQLIFVMGKRADQLFDMLQASHAEYNNVMTKHHSALNILMSQMRTSLMNLKTYCEMCQLEEVREVKINENQNLL